MARTTGHLLNRAPTQQLGWKTPFEALHGCKSDLSHLHVYRCKSFYLQHKIPRKDKLLPRAHIGYLVSYDSTNIFRIWRPDKSRVICVRDAVFDEEAILFPDTYKPQELLTLEQIEEIPDTLDPNQKCPKYERRICT